MRLAIILTTALGFAGSAFAADGPTMEQRNTAWKADYSKMWTKSDFKTACDAMMMKKAPMGTSDPAGGK
jgi:hypothetical protein